MTCAPSVLACRDALVEDAAFLVAAGECWSQAVRRLGYPGHPQSLERRLDRAGRHDLVRDLKAREVWDLTRPAMNARKVRTRTA